MSASVDRTLRLWDVLTEECRRTLSGHTGSVHSVMYLPSGNLIVSRSSDKTLRIWDVETGECNHTLHGHDEFHSLICSPQGDHVAATDGATVRVWDIGIGQCRHIFICGKVGVRSVAYSPKGDQIACGGIYGSARIWDLKASSCLWTLSGHNGIVTKIVYSSQGDIVISASDDKSVRVWDIASGQCRAVIQDFQAGVRSIAWVETYGCNYLVAGCEDGVIGMWQVLVDEAHCNVSLRWKTTNGELDMKDTTIQDVQGLSQLNRKLLKQRGAVGEPAHTLREAGKKVTTMVSVISKIKVLSQRDVDSPSSSTSGALARELEQTFEQKFQQAKGSLLQVKDSLLNVMATVEKNIQECE